VWDRLMNAEILTIADVQRRMADRSIADVSGLGPRRLEVLRTALDRWEREHDTEARAA
jgi:hypothetical protein